MLWLTIGVFLVATVIFCIGLFVALRDIRLESNRYFGLFALMLAVWMTFNYLGANYKESNFASVFIHVDFLLGPLLAFSFWRFTKTFYVQVKKIKHEASATIAVLSTAVATSLISLSPAVVQLVDESGTNTIVYGRLYPLYSAILFGIIILSIANLITAVRKGSPTLRSQVSLMLWGLIIATAFVAAANLLVPQLTDSSTINLIAGNFSYIGVALFVVLTAYSIAKHRLFDVRLAVARTIAYFLVFSSLVILYSSVVFVFAQRIVEQENTWLAQLIPFMAAMFVALLFAPLKRFFDRVTNKYFYQDAYDQQSLFNDLNAALVASLDLSNILKTTSLLLEHYLRTKYVGFFVLGSKDYPASKYITDESVRLTENDIKAIAHLSSEKVISVFDDEQDSQANELRQKKEVDLVAKLAISAEKSEVLGVIILGPKKSGNVLSAKDQKTMEIIADELVIAIQNALRFEEIQQFNITLQQKVDDATKQLRAANQKLIAMDQTKDDFISMASHQLRTPLTSVKGYLSMVLEGDVGKVSPQQKKLLDQAFLSAQRMVYLIADLLNVSRLKTGKFIIESHPTNLAEVISGELDQLKETAVARELTMTYEKPDKFPTLELDETKIRQVIMNFVDNAIYYTPSGGHITVDLQDRGETVEFTVTDDGIGVPKDEQHNLFTKFYRANNAKKARPDGTGLGLFMAKKVIIAQGGAIIFKTQEGKGSTFGFSFNKHKLAASRSHQGNPPETTDNPDN